MMLSVTPEILLPPVWPNPRSLATTSGISVDVFSSPYLDVSVQAVPHRTLWIGVRFLWYCHRGFPHSEISGSVLICSSPKLIAAYHVLHRLLMPRHSPCALISLTSSTLASHIPHSSCQPFGFQSECSDASGVSSPNQTRSRWALIWQVNSNRKSIWFSIELNYAGSHKRSF